MSVSKGTVVLVGSAVGIPAGDWALAYGKVVDICGDRCHAEINVGDFNILVDLTEHSFGADQPMSWEGKSIDEMTEAESATFHTVWSNHWIPVQYFSGGKWVTPHHQTRLAKFKNLNSALPRRIKPSEGAEQIAKLHARREEIANEIAKLKGEDAALVANLLLL